MKVIFHEYFSSLAGNIIGALFSSRIITKTLIYQQPQFTPKSSTLFFFFSISGMKWLIWICKCLLDMWQNSVAHLDMTRLKEPKLQIISSSHHMSSLCPLFTWCMINWWLQILSSPFRLCEFSELSEISYRVSAANASWFLCCSFSLFYLMSIFKSFVLTARNHLPMWLTEAGRR